VLRAVFGPETLSAVTGRFLLVGVPGRGEVHSYGAEGALEAVARLPWPAEPVTSGMIAEYRERATPPLPESWIEGQTFADELPAFSGLLIDEEGNAWLRRYEPLHALPATQYLPTLDAPSTWAVLDPDGRWLGDVRVPASLHLLEIGTDYVLGLHRDEFEVEYLRVHDLRKP